MKGHRAFKKFLRVILIQRLEVLKKENCSKILKDIEERELATINDIQLGQEDHISDMPTSSIAKSKSHLTERDQSQGQTDGYHTPHR
jgi:hypothetical protein